MDSGHGPGTSVPIAETLQVLSNYIAGTLDRELPADVLARVKLHVLDTFAAMISGSRLKPGILAARYVETLGGTPQATVVGTRFLTSTVNAALANAMAAHADETDDTNPIGPVHLGCAATSAAFATGELAGRSGTDLLRAVCLAYDVGARVVSSLGIHSMSKHRTPSAFTNGFVAASAAAAMLRLDARQVRHVLSYTAEQASGTTMWKRDTEHVLKAFCFGGVGARNGVTAATMVACGLSGVEDILTGKDDFFSVFADKPHPEKLTAGLGSQYAVFDTSIKKWAVGAPMLSVLQAIEALLPQPGVDSRNIASISVTVDGHALRIIDNAVIPDLCLQHLVALMIVDRRATFASVHDFGRMRDPEVLAMRKLVNVITSDEVPPRQAIVKIGTLDGRSFSHYAKVVRGTAADPLDASEVEAKARDLMAPVLGEAATSALIAALLNLEQLPSLGELRPLLQA